MVCWGYPGYNSIVFQFINQFLLGVLETSYVVTRVIIGILFIIFIVRIVTIRRLKASVGGNALQVTVLPIRR